MFLWSKIHLDFVGANLTVIDTIQKCKCLFSIIFVALQKFTFYKNSDFYKSANFEGSNPWMVWTTRDSRSRNVLTLTLKVFGSLHLKQKHSKFIWLFFGRLLMAFITHYTLQCFFNGNQLLQMHIISFFSPCQSLISVNHLINLLSRTGSFLVSIPLSNSDLATFHLPLPPFRRRPSHALTRSCSWLFFTTFSSGHSSKRRNAEMGFRTDDPSELILRSEY